MKKEIRILLMVLLFSSINMVNIHGDEFTDAIQDLAMWAACIGQYSASESSGGRTEDPKDYYTPRDIANRLAQESGNKTSTETFYGVCFNYAQHAWSYVEKYKSYYNSKGMYEGQFWLAGVNENPNTIVLSNPTTRENATIIQNGVPLKTYSTSNRAVKPHKGTDGIRATHHAWIWIERSDGVWFWIDPTWTDNLGYVVYGYVRNDEEIQCRPDQRFCKIYPSHLNNLPLPPARGQRMSPSSTATSNFANRSETINDVASNYQNDIIRISKHMGIQMLAYWKSKGLDDDMIQELMGLFYNRIEYAKSRGRKLNKHDIRYIQNYFTGNHRLDGKITGKFDVSGPLASDRKLCDALNAMF